MKGINIVKMNKITLFVIVLISFSFGKLANGQTVLPKVVPPSPEATSLGKFVDMPVGLYTGIPQISIPIYNITINNRSVPISINYHAGGVKVAEIPSSVGSGWALNAGGVISRTVRGKVDEKVGGYIVSPSIPSGSNALTGYAAQDYLRETCDLNHFDTEPDMFYFNFNGVTGKFVIDKNRKIHQIPYSNLRIEPINTSLTGWKITTEDGVEYDFYTTELNSETLSSTGSYYSSWYLSEIKYPDTDQSITFDYATERVDYTLPVAELRYEYSQLPVGNSSNTLNVNYNEQLNSYNQTSAIRIARINFPNGKVEFIPGNFRKDYKNGRTLGRIEISSNNGLLKSFRFNYNYLSKNANPTLDDGAATGSTVPDTQLRLFLKDIQEYGSDNLTVKKPYVFSYNTSVGLPDRLLSKALDHWGYYNGIDQNITLIPTHSNYNSVLYEGGVRDVSESAAKAGILTKITYPTSGSTEFDYESNQATTNAFSAGNESYVGSNYTVGNCRVSALGEFSIKDDFNSTVKMTIGLRTQATGDSYTITRKICNGNSSGSIPSSVANYIYFQILDISDPASPRIVYNSADDNWGIGAITMAVSKQIKLPLGTYRIKAIKGNSNFSLNAPEITDADGNFVTKFVFEIRGAVYTLPKDESIGSVVGGLRIKQMINFDPISQQSIIKSYDYTDNGRSSGVINWVPVYQYSYDEEILPNSFFGYNVYTSSSGLPLTEMQGGNVGYSKVTVSDVDDLGLSITNGKSEYYYSNPKDYYFNPYTFQTSLSGSNQTLSFVNRAAFNNSRFSYPFAPGLSADWSRGLLINQIDFLKNQDGSFSKVKEIVNKYKDDYLGAMYDYNPEYDVMAAKIAITTRQNVSYNATSPGPFHKYAIQYYYIPSRYSKLVETTEISYNLSSSVTSTKTFSYDNLANLQPSSITFINSKSDNRKIIYKYPNDFPTESIYQTMTNKNILNPVIQQEEYNNNSFLSQTKTNYDIWNNVIAPSVLEIKKLNFPIDPKLRYYAYNSNGNILDVAKIAGIHFGYQWAYNRQYAVAECKNASNTEFYYEGFEESEAQGVVSSPGHTGLKYTTNGSVNWMRPNARPYVVSYWYLSGGIWKYSGEQVYASENFAMLAASGYDDIRIYPSDAEITTYTYSPLIGMTSSIDPKGETVFYEYDQFQRLKNVKDQNGNILKSNTYHYQN